MKELIPFLSKNLPIGLAVRGLAGNPRVSNFLSSSVAAGYGIDTAIDYMRSLFEGEPLQRRKENLKRRSESGSALPYEEESLENISPSTGAKLAQTGASLLGGIGAGALYDKATRSSKSIAPRMSKAITPEVFPAEKKLKGLPYERKELGTSSKQKQIGFSPRTKVPDHKFPEPKVPPTSPIPADIEEKIRFHMDKSGLSVEDAVDVTEALDPSKKKIIKDLKKKGAFESLRGATNTVAPSSPQSPESAPAQGEDEILRLIEELSRKLNG